MTEAYPLHWPAGRPRIDATKRKRSPFSQRKTDWKRGFTYTQNLTVAAARDRLVSEAGLLTVRGLVISTNLEVRRDGLPKSNKRSVQDPGVAVYFDLDGRPVCLSCDQYDDVAGNMAAVAAHIEATRKIARHGVGTAAQMFEGFAALPAPGSTPWWQVLGVSQGSSRAERLGAYKRLARERHPDATGGSHELMADLNRAREEALNETGDQP